MEVAGTGSGQNLSGALLEAEGGSGGDIHYFRARRRKWVLFVEGGEALCKRSEGLAGYVDFRIVLRAGRVIPGRSVSGEILTMCPMPHRENIGISLYRGSGFGRVESPGNGGTV